MYCFTFILSTHIFYYTKENSYITEYCTEYIYYLLMLLKQSFQLAGFKVIHTRLNKICYILFIVYCKFYFN